MGLLEAFQKKKGGIGDFFLLQKFLKEFVISGEITTIKTLYKRLCINAQNAGVLEVAISSFM